MSPRLVGELAADGFPVAVTCRVLGLPRSTFYDAVSGPPSPRAVEDARLTTLILEVHADSRDTYGAPRVHAELRLGLGLAAARKRVARLMRGAAGDGLDVKHVLRAPGHHHVCVSMPSPTQRERPSAEETQGPASKSHCFQPLCVPISHVVVPRRGRERDVPGALVGRRKARELGRNRGDVESNRRPQLLKRLVGGSRRASHGRSAVERVHDRLSECYVVHRRHDSGRQWWRTKRP